MENEKNQPLMLVPILIIVPNHIYFVYTPYDTNDIIQWVHDDIFMH